MESIEARKLTEKGRQGTRLTLPFLAECMFYITLVCNFFILLGNPLGIDFMVSTATRILLISVLLVGFMVVLNSLKRSVPVSTALFVTIFLLTVVFSILSGIGVFLDKFVNVICFLMLPTYMVAGKYAGRITNLKNSIYIGNVFYALLFLGLFLGGYAYYGYGEYGEYVSEDLTLGYPNPNETGIYLLVSFMVMLIAVASVKNKWYRIPLLALSAMLLCFIILTGSRSCILLSAAFLFVFLLKLYRKIGKKTRVLILLFPIVSAVLMMIFPEFFEEWIILGDSADNARSFLFLEAFRSVDMRTLFLGNLREYGGANLHNGYFSIFIEYGLIVFALYYAFLGKTFAGYKKNMMTDPAMLAYAAVFAIVLHGAVEGTFFIAGTVFSGLSGLFFILMREEKAP